MASIFFHTLGRRTRDHKLGRRDLASLSAPWYRKACLRKKARPLAQAGLCSPLRSHHHRPPESHVSIRSHPLPACVLIVCALGCSDPKDRPQDCTTSEFFDEVDELCKSCPALVEPQGCTGRITIQKDSRGCPESVCVSQDEMRCPEGTVFETSSLSCEPVKCGQGFTLSATLRRCVRTP